jgi:hypothetical protein
MKHVKNQTQETPHRASLPGLGNFPIFSPLKPLHPPVMQAGNLGTIFIISSNPLKILLVFFWANVQAS